MRTFSCHRILRAAGAALAAAATCATLVAPAPAGAFTISDAFTDNKKDRRIWGKDVAIVGNGVLTEVNRRLEFTVVTPSTDADYTLRPLVWGKAPYDAGWSVQITLRTALKTASNDQYGSIGLSVLKCGDYTSEVYAELYSVGLPMDKGIYTEIRTNDLGGGDSDDWTRTTLPVAALVRTSFNATAKVLTIAKKTGTSWTTLASYGVSAADGGASGNGDWGMTDGDRFCLAPYGYSHDVRVPRGALYGDGFTAHGIIPSKILLTDPNGGETIDPTKNFPVTWFQPPNIDHVKLAWSCTNGAAWTPITPDPPAGATSYDWNVPNGQSGKTACRVKVSAYGATGTVLGTDTSDRAFRIQMP